MYGFKIGNGYCLISNKSYRRNRLEIKDQILNHQNQNTDVICAWGKKSEMSKNLLDDAIENVVCYLQGYNYNLLEGVVVGGNLRLQNYTYNQNHYPLHPFCWP